MYCKRQARCYCLLSARHDQWPFGVPMHSNKGKAYHLCLELTFAIGNIANTFPKQLFWVKIKVVIDWSSFFIDFDAFRFQKNGTHVTFLPRNGTFQCSSVSTNLKRNSELKKKSLKNILWYKVTIRKLNTLSQCFCKKKKQWKLLSFESFPDNYV